MSAGYLWFGLEKRGNSRHQNPASLHCEWYAMIVVQRLSSGCAALERALVHVAVRVRPIPVQGVPIGVAIVSQTHDVTEFVSKEGRVEGYAVADGEGPRGGILRIRPQGAALPASPGLIDDQVDDIRGVAVPQDKRFIHEAVRRIDESVQVLSLVP